MHWWERRCLHVLGGLWARASLGMRWTSCSTVLPACPAPRAPNGACAAPLHRAAWRSPSCLVTPRLRKRVGAKASAWWRRSSPRSRTPVRRGAASAIPALPSAWRRPGSTTNCTLGLWNPSPFADARSVSKIRHVWVVAARFSRREKALYRVLGDATEAFSTGSTPEGPGAAGLVAASWTDAPGDYRASPARQRRSGCALPRPR